jgi:hypothetical protein
VHFGGAFASVVKSNVTRSAHRPPVAATARRSAGVGFRAVRIGSVVPTPWHATVVVVTARVVEVVEADTLIVVVVVVVGVVASVVVSDVAAGLSELLHAAASGNSAKATNT